MTDIPDDIFKVAQAVFLNNLGRGMVQNIEAIAHAILAERERCAGVARLAMVNNPDADEYTCSICAAEIRKGTQ